MPTVRIPRKRTYSEDELASLVADVLRMLKEDHDLSQADVARELGITQAAVSRATMSGAENRNLKTQRRILERYAGVTVEVERTFRLAPLAGRSEHS